MLLKFSTGRQQDDNACIDVFETGNFLNFNHTDVLLRGI